MVEGLDLADGLTGNFRVGHGNAGVFKPSVLGQLHWVFFTQDLNGLIDGLFGAVEQVGLPLAQWHFGDGEAVALFIGDDTSSHYGLAGNAVDMASGVIEVLGQAHAFGYELGGNHALCAGIFLMVDLDNLCADGGDEDRADYRTWVGQGVTDDRGGIAHHFHHGGHARRGGERTGEHADGFWHAHAKATDEAIANGDQNNQHAQHEDGELPAAGFKLADEGRPEVEANGINEDRQAKLIDQRRNLDFRIGSRQTKCHKHRGRGTERDAEDLDLANR